MQLTSPLVALIISQCADQTVHQAQVCQLKQAIRQGNREQQCFAADSLYEQLSPYASLELCDDLAKESGSSPWLRVLPVQEHAFHLHKGDFRDALSLHYSLLPLHTAKTYHCGTSFC